MTKSAFVEIETLRDPDGMGLVAAITAKQKDNGYTAYSFAIFKEFERSTGGPTQRTNYLNERHIGAARKLIDMVEARIAVSRDQLHEQKRKASK